MKRFLNTLLLVCCTNFCAYAFIYCGSGLTDKICQVNFNKSRCGSNYLKSWQSDSSFYTCLNQSLLDANGNRKNISWEIRANCREKCHQEFVGFANPNGTFNLETIASRVKKNYALYSNATTEYVQKIVDMAIRCAKLAESDLLWHQARIKSDKVDCKVNGLFENCCDDVNDKLHRGTNKDTNITELCAAQGTILNQKE